MVPLSARSEVWTRVPLLPKQRDQLARALASSSCSSDAESLMSNSPITLDSVIGCAAKRLAPSLSATAEKDCSTGEVAGAKHMPRCSTKASCSDACTLPLDVCKARATRMADAHAFQ